MSLLKIILLNDMLNTELLNVKPNTIQDRDIAERRLKLRLKNSLKSSRMLSEISDEFFEGKDVTTMFGDVADVMKDLFDAYIENRLKIQGQHFVNFPDGFTSEMFKELFRNILNGTVSLDPKMHASKFTINATMKKSNKNVIDHINAVDEEDAIVLFKHMYPSCIIKNVKKDLEVK